jgi:hypothetical protein
MYLHNRQPAAHRALSSKKEMYFPPEKTGLQYSKTPANISCRYSVNYCIRRENL